MKKLFLSLSVLFFMGLNAMAQSPGTVMMKHSQDFLVASFTYDTWTGAPDSIKTGGFSHGFNIAFTYDVSLGDDSHFSVAPGIGISASHMSFKNQKAIIGGEGAQMKFVKDSIDKKFRLINTYVEIPVELRYRSFSHNANSGFKAALGLKFGAMFDAHTKAKREIRGFKQTEKIKNNKYFERWRVAATIRAGYGHFGIYASYSLTPLLKANAGAKIRPFSIGLAISGF